MSRGLHWFRNDLRLTDNGALDALFRRCEAWLPVVVLDPRLAQRGAALRTRFWRDAVAHLADALAARGAPLLLRRGRPERVLPKLCRETGATWLSFGASTSPFAARRDAAVVRAVEKRGVRVLRASDHVVFAADELRTGSGSPYAVFTPYRNAWWRRFREEPRPPRRMHRAPAPIPGFAADAVPEDRALVGAAGAEVALPAAGEAPARARLRRFLEGAAGDYHRDRDRPDRDGTSRLSAQLRFGTLSIRQCFDAGLQAAAADRSLRRGVAKWLDELIWREFYAAILANRARVQRESYRREYDTLVWSDDPEGFAAWRAGRTGFPIVDAGMRQLATTGWMHNRVRMITASFLAKDLLIDWREGERFFFAHLVDGDPASNNGGWQWAASTGTDAQPYFRIFNPVSQGRRHDPDGAYVKRFVPELRGLPAARVHEPWKEGAGPADYPPPIVDHAARREEALRRYRRARRTAS